MRRFVAISGCSGGGKSTLIAALARRGFATVAEPGRRIVAEQIASGGDALPWVSLERFARRAVEVARSDLVAAERMQGWVFFDRGLVDAAVALEHATGEPAGRTLGPDAAYHPRVFLAPPWPELFAEDEARRHGLAEAEAEYARLTKAYPALGYRPVILPRTGVEARADFVLAHLAE